MANLAAPKAIDTGPTVLLAEAVTPQAEWSTHVSASGTTLILLL